MQAKADAESDVEDDHYANMLWLDSIYPTDSSQPGSYRGACGIDSGDPKDVGTDQADATVKFSNILFGPIGSTIHSALVAWMPAST